MTISADRIVQKNLISGTGADLLMIKVEYPGEDPKYLTTNDEETVWNSETWYPIKLNLDDLKEDKEGSAPSSKINFADIERRIVPYLDEYGGAVGSEITLYSVHSTMLDNPVADEIDILSLCKTTVDGYSNVEIELGAENLYNYLMPQDSYMKDHCCLIRPFWGGFKGVYCKYDGEETECDGTYARCLELENTYNCRAVPTLGNNGVMI